MPPNDAPGLAVHLLDVGQEEYGDALLIEAGGRRILVDGGHRSDLRGSAGHPAVPDQLRSLTGEQTPRIDLLLVTHAHLDHIGCLPELVTGGHVEVHNALLADPDLGWGQGVGPAPAPAPDAAGIADLVVRSAVAGLREEAPPAALPDAALADFLADAAGLRDRYRAMIDRLVAGGATVTLFGPQSATAVEQEFRAIGLKVIGPTVAQLEACARGMAGPAGDARDLADRLLARDAVADAVDLYRALRADQADQDAASEQRPGALVNLQSIVVTIGAAGRRLYLGGDSQLADPGTRDAVIAREIELLRARIRRRRPYAFVKLGHHGSTNALDADTLADFGASRLFGICLGAGSTKHPEQEVLDLLAARPGAVWARTDRNGLTSMRLVDRHWEVATARARRTT